MPTPDYKTNKSIRAVEALGPGVHQIGPRLYVKCVPRKDGLRRSVQLRWYDGKQHSKSLGPWRSELYGHFLAEARRAGEAINDDRFDNILAVVRTCVRAGRADLIEPALIDRQHVSAVAAQIDAERRSSRAPASAAGSSGDALAAAVERRFRAYAQGGEVNAGAAAPPPQGATR
jgi:hypothetical protein